MPGLAHRGLDPQGIAPGLFRVFHAQKQVVRAGFRRDVDATPLGVSNQRQRVPAVFVGDMDGAAGPLTEQRDARYRLHGSDIGMLLEMGGKISAPGSLQPRAAPVENGRVLGVGRTAKAKRRDHRQRVEHRAVIGAWNQGIVAAKIELEGNGSGFGHRREQIDVVLADITIDPEIDESTARRHRDLLPDGVGM